MQYKDWWIDRIINDVDYVIVHNRSRNPPDAQSDLGSPLYNMNNIQPPNDTFG